MNIEAGWEARALCWSERVLIRQTQGSWPLIALITPRDSCSYRAGMGEAFGVSLPIASLEGRISGECGMRNTRGEPAKDAKEIPYSCGWRG